MSLIRINSQPSRRQLLVFAAAWAVFVSAWGIVAWKRGNPSLAGMLVVIASVVPLAGLVFAPLLRWLYVGLSYATYPIGFVISHVVLAILYYLVFTPIGLIMRLLRYDPLTRRFDPKASSYWQERANPKPTASYFRQD